MKYEIRQLNLEEAIKALHLLSSYSFQPTPPLPDEEKFAKGIRNREGATYFAVTVAGEIQTIACSTTPFLQNLRGKSFMMGGVADVCTHPAARRKGYARLLMNHLYQQFMTEGMAVSCLYPFKEDFYQRLGYVTFPQAKKIKFQPECLKPILKKKLPGSVELMPFKDNFSLYRAFVEKHQAVTHGMAIYSIPQVEAARSRETWLAVARQGEEVIGLMQYRLKGPILKQDMAAFDFLYVNAQGKFLLLDWIARHLDQVANVQMVLNPGVPGETLFTDIRPEIERYFIAPMGRVISIETLAGLPVGPGKISVQITDPDCPWNEGYWHLSGEDGELVVRRAEKGDYELTIQGLSALIFGVYDPDEFALRGWGNPDEEVQNQLRQLFPSAVPFLHAMY